MTMPKFEPVAIRYEDARGNYRYRGFVPNFMSEYSLLKPIALHPAEQLAEAHEAGKRDASEDLEQAAFEKWLHDKCPSGDVESVQRQWLKSYEYSELLDETKCGNCHGSGRMVRDPDIGTDQECFVCDGTGVNIDA